MLECFFFPEENIIELKQFLIPKLKTATIMQ